MTHLLVNLRGVTITTVLMSGFGLIGLAFANSSWTPPQEEAVQEESASTTDATAQLNEISETIAAVEETSAAVDRALQFILMARADYDSSTDEGSGEPMLGVHVRQASDTLRTQLGIDGQFGLVIEHVTPASGAEQADLQIHDVVTKLNDQRLVNIDQFQTLIDAQNPGDQVMVEFIRRGSTQRISVSLSERKKLDTASTVMELENYHATLLSGDVPHATMLKHLQFQDCRACHATHNEIQAVDFSAIEALIPADDQ